MRLFFAFLVGCSASHGPADVLTPDDAPDVPVADAPIDGGVDAWRWSRDAGMIDPRDSIFWLLAQPDEGVPHELPGGYVIVETDLEGHRLGAWSVPGSTPDRLVSLREFRDPEGIAGFTGLGVTTAHEVFVLFHSVVVGEEPWYVAVLEPGEGAWSSRGPDRFLGISGNEYFPAAPLVTEQGALVGNVDAPDDAERDTLIVWHPDGRETSASIEPYHQPALRVPARVDADGSVAWLTERCTSSADLPCVIRYDPASLELISADRRTPVNAPGGRLLDLSASTVRGSGTVFLRSGLAPETIAELELADAPYVYGPADVVSVDRSGRVLGTWSIAESAVLVSPDFSEAHYVRPEYEHAIVVRAVFSDPYRE